MGLLAIAGVVVLSAFNLAILQLNYAMLAELNARGVEHIGPLISVSEPPSVRVELLAASLGAFPHNIPAILELISLVAGVALIIGTQRQLAEMKALLAVSDLRQKRHGDA
jgi:hypothetical protein